MGTDYVSEFTVFMNRYLGEHPEAVEEQRRGWGSFWIPKTGLDAQEEADEDLVPDDGYGFSWSAWRAESPEAESPRSH